MKETMERRKSFRMPFNAKVFCRTNGGEFHGTIENLSSTGLFMKSKNYPSVMTSCDLEIVLNGTHSRLRIDSLKGQVVRGDEIGAGIQFSERLEGVALIPIYNHKGTGADAELSASAPPV